ncbi:ATPase [Micromonospora sp. DR5-3]|uniref:ATPase n=1 Tax=unclassified Micromonospora TaxID=2617518 RepID=UPI0011DC0728|nr:MULTISPECIES: ATPase [unclassified Micromonospora]MCW3817333.1 ATPase [Micromonospora sp. DR5-3]TYC24038.1 ATPase [Micromonospora sp. MP36]
MDGSETGWGRQAEPAPRWRALLDRARHGPRGAEQIDADHRPAGPPPPADPLPRRTAGTGWTGRAQAVGRPAEPPYGAEQPPYRVEATYRVEPAHRLEPGYGGEPVGRAEPPYRAEPDHRSEPSWRAEPTYRAEPESGHPGGAEPSWRAEATYRAEPEPGHPGGSEPSWRAEPYRAEPESGHPGGAEPSWRAEPTYRAEPEPGHRDPEPRGRGTAPVESRYGLQELGHRPDPPPVESRYALLDRGRYRPENHQPAAPVPPVPVQRPPADGYPARVEPARVEWRAPKPEDEVERAVGVLRRELGRPRVLAFANPKGGVHKTTATVLAAATVGSVRGRGVLAWDDNELRGTLGLRAGSARHARTIRHLIHDLAQIEILEGAALLEHLDDYLRHASDGSYDVLAGEESPRFAQRLDQFTVKRVLELLRRTHEVVCVDTGNNVESPNWRTVMQAADQLVVTTVPREDAAFSADWMLDLLHEVGMGELADNAVTLISCPTPGRTSIQDDLERHFATRTRAVTVVPYDPALETGSSIDHHQLQAETRQAWLKAAAVMLEPFAR